MTYVGRGFFIFFFRASSICTVLEILWYNIIPQTFFGRFLHNHYNPSVYQKEMSLKLTQNFITTRIHFRVRGVHRKFHSTQVRYHSTGNRPLDSQRYMTWERPPEVNTRLASRFSELNTKYIKHFSEVKKVCPHSKNVDNSSLDSFTKIY